MRDGQVESQLREIFSTVLNLPAAEVIPALTPDTCSSWDSLHHIHLVSAIDEVFSIKLTIEQQMEIMSFDLAVDVVSEALSAPKPA